MTFYHNPARRRRPLVNYQRFRRELSAQKVPLVTVEYLLSDAAPQLAADGETLLRVRGGDGLCQRERLLNHAIHQLDAAYDTVAWLEPNIIFLDPCWRERAELLLRRLDVLQLFQTACQLPAFPGEPTDLGRVTPGHLAHRQLRAAWGLPGGAWAARRELLQRHGLYDAAIGGDGADWFVRALRGEPDLAAAPMFPMASMGATAMSAHFQRWAAPLTGRLRSGFLPTTILQLHDPGCEADGAAVAAALAAHDFTPERDLRIGPDGAWQWQGSQPKLQRQLRELFAAQQVYAAQQEQPPQRGCGILTSAHAGDFSAAMRLVAAVRAVTPATPLHMLDLGLTAEQRQQLRDVEVAITPFACGALAHRAGLTLGEARAFSLPLQLERSPFQRTLWLEPQEPVPAELPVWLAHLEERPPLGPAPAFGAAHGPGCPPLPAIGVDGERDARLLAQWAAWAWELFVYPERRNLVLWTLLKTEASRNLPSSATRS